MERTEKIEPRFSLSKSEWKGRKKMESMEGIKGFSQLNHCRMFYIVRISSKTRSAPLSDGPRNGRREGGEGVGEIVKEREKLWRQRAEARRTTTVTQWQRDEGWRRVGKRAEGTGRGKGPNAGSTFIHKTKAESDKERIVSGTRTITGSTNALACQRARVVESVEYS